MDLQHFYLAGINYKKTDVSIRGQFALDTQQYENVLSQAKALGLDNVFIISTCNRTEIYGVAPSVQMLTNLLCAHTLGDSETFERLAYIRQAREAAEHLFEVAAGIDSQILGDYEIMGQMKQSVKIAREQGTVSAFLERLSNTAFQSSKDIKNKTALSGGTVSVSFAAIQFLKWHNQDFNKKKIVIIGSGSIGTNTAKNIIDYLHTHNVTMVNRTDSKAKALAKELQILYCPFDQLYTCIKDADIIITATNSQKPIVAKEHIAGLKGKILIDLSIPNNININVREVPGTIFVNVDELSQISQETYHQRALEVPAAKKIIDEYLNEFFDWYKMRKNVPFIRAAKEAIMNLHQCGIIPQAVAEESAVDYLPADIAMNKAIKNMAVKMKESEQKPGCTYLQAITDYVTSTSN